MIPDELFDALCRTARERGGLRLAQGPWNIRPPQ